MTTATTLDGLLAQARRSIADYGLYAWVTSGTCVAAYLGCVLTELLPPLEETTDPDDKTTPDFHFSRSYLAARAKFLARAHRAGGEITSAVIWRDDELGVDLTTDAAFFRGSQPDRLVVHLSGTHGVEGFAGSAVQCKLLEKITEEKHGKPIVEGPSVLMVHAVNPFGFHFNRRFNEDNVDVNRNWLFTEEQWAKAKARPLNQFGYASLNWLLNPRLARWWQYFTTNVANILMAVPFAGRVRRAVISAQYRDQKGLYFGGFQNTLSTLNLRAVIEKYRRGVQHVICIDVHSGLGPTGEDTLMVDAPAVRDRAAATLPRQASRLSAPENGGASSGYDTAMGCVEILDAMPDATGFSLTQEFGTRSPAIVLAALIFENSVFWNTHRHSRAREFGGRMLRNAFFVETRAWKKSVLERGEDLFADSVQALMKQSQTA